MSQRHGLRWNCWPSATDTALLQVLLDLDDRRALSIWQQLRTELDLDAPTSEQYRQYPMLARRLAVLDPSEPRLGMLRGVARQVTIQNLRHLAALDQLLGLLAEVEIDAVVLKGPALVLSVYEHLGLRWFADADIWVGIANHERALSALTAAGWSPTRVDHRGNHAIDMIGGPIPVDLHRAINPELVTAAMHDGGWEALQRITASRPLPSGRHVTVLAPPESLLHAIVHGTQWGGPVQIRWVVDVVELLRSGQIDLGVPADRHRLIDLACQFGVAPVIHDGLCFVEQVAPDTVDSRVLVELAAVRSSLLDRLRMTAFHEDPSGERSMRGLGRATSRFIQRTRAMGAIEAIRLAPGYFTEATGASSPWRLPGIALRWGIGRCVQFVRRSRHR